VEEKFLSEEIKGERICLRKHKLEQADEMFLFVDQDRERLTEFLPWVNFVNTTEDELDFLKNTHKWWEESSQFDYSIFENSSNQYLGNISVHSIKWSHDTAELGYLLRKEAEGQGFMIEAIKLLEKELFNQGFVRIEIRAFTQNTRSQQTALKADYIKEGILRKAFRYGENQYRDCALFAKVKA